MLHIRDFVDQDGHRHHTATADLTVVAGNVGPEVRAGSGAVIRTAIVVIAAVVLTLAVLNQSPIVPLEGTIFLGP